MVRLIEHGYSGFDPAELLRCKQSAKASAYDHDAR